MIRRFNVKEAASFLARCFVTGPCSSPHPSLKVIPDYLSKDDQRLLVGYSLNLLSNPSRTSAKARRLAREYRRSNPSYDPLKDGFMPEQNYEFERGHFDGVITSYREMLVREGMAQDASPELINVLQRCYALLPRPQATSCAITSTDDIHAVDPPIHLIMHLLHLSGSHGRILPHVDNAEAFGQTIVGISLGSERVMKFKRTGIPSASPGNAPAAQGPDEFQVLLRPGDAYVQR